MSKNILDFFGKGKDKGENEPIDIDKAISKAVIDNNFNLDVSPLQPED